MFLQQERLEMDDFEKENMVVKENFNILRAYWEKF